MGVGRDLPRGSSNWENLKKTPGLYLFPLELCLAPTGWVKKDTDPIFDGETT